MDVNIHYGWPPSISRLIRVPSFSTRPLTPRAVHTSVFDASGRGAVAPRYAEPTMGTEASRGTAVPRSGRHSSPGLPSPHRRRPLVDTRYKWFTAGPPIQCRPSSYQRSTVYRAVDACCTVTRGGGLLQPGHSSFFGRVFASSRRPRPRY